MESLSRLTFECECSCSNAEQPAGMTVIKPLRRCMVVVGASATNFDRRQVWACIAKVMQMLQLTDTRFSELGGLLLQRRCPAEQS